MAGQYAVLKAAIEAVIKTNGNNEITGALMQQSLLSMITSLGAYYDFVDVATPSTNPGTLDQNVFYFAATAGTYSNFGGIVVNDGETCFLCYNGTWTKKVSGAATAAQVAALGQKIDGLALGKFYGFIDDVADLPAGDEPGYAYVGASSPFAIYNFNGNSWSDSGAVEQYEPPVPNMEDIDFNSDGKLQFANRSVSSGMGYKILRMNATFASQVTAANTIYEIRYDFDLAGGSVTIPAGCVLKFAGGKIINGSIIANKTRIDAELVQIFGTNVEISGDVIIKQWECAWFGAINDGLMTTTAGSPASFSGTDNFDAIQSTIYNALQTNVRKIHLHQGNFRLTKPIFLGLAGYNNLIFFGDSFTLLREGGNAGTRGTALFFDTPIGGIFVNSSRGTTISNLGIYGLNHYYAGNISYTNMSQDPADWYYDTIEKHSGLYCAGISIDAIRNNPDFVPFTDKYGMNLNPASVGLSSYVKIQNCTISGFASGLDLQTTCPNAGNCDFIYCNRVDFSYCVYGCRNYANQCRLLNFDYCRFSAINTGLVNRDNDHSRWGNMGGKLTLCEFGFVYQFFDLGDNVPTFDQCSGENNYRFGKYVNSGNTTPFLFLGGRYSFRQSATNPNIGIIPLIESALLLSEWAIMVNTSIATAPDTGKSLILPNIICYGANMSSSQKIVPIPLAVNGYQMCPEFAVQRVPASVSGLQITISATLPNINVGDYLVDITTNGVFQVITNAGNSLTIEALTYIKGTTINTDLFDITRNINWYKMNKPYGQITNQNGMAIIRGALPTASESYTKGMWIYSIPQLKPAWWDGSKFVDAKGFTLARNSGTTAQRPVLTASDAGFQYLDTSLSPKRPIWWNGSAWVDATGAAV